MGTGFKEYLAKVTKVIISRQQLSVLRFLLPILFSC